MVSDGKMMRGGPEESGESSPNGKSSKYATKKVDKIENDVEKLIGKVDAIATILATQSPLFSNKTLSPAQPNDILQKFCTPPTTKSGCRKVLRTLHSLQGS